MGTFFIYILTAAFSLVIFYLFYKLLLTRETFHRFNRITLLIIVTLSMLLPLCKITLHTRIELHPVIVLIEEFRTAADLTTGYDPVTLSGEQAPFPWIHLIFFIYLTGLLFYYPLSLGNRQPHDTYTQEQKNIYRKTPPGHT